MNGVNVWSKGDGDAGNERQNNIKDPVVLSYHLPLVLSGLQLLSGIQLVVGDRVLVTTQADSTENGIYVASDTTWTRATDFNDNDDFVNGTMVLDTSSAIMYYAKVTGAIDIGLTDIVFAPVTYNAGVTYEAFVATAGQTVFTLATTYSKIFDNVSLRIDGIWQEPVNAYTKTGVNDITLSATPALEAGNRVVFAIHEELANAAALVYDATAVTFTETGQAISTVDAALNALIVQVDSISVSSDADTVDGLHASAAAVANTLLALDASSKLPASITGDAATVGGLDAAALSALAAGTPPTIQSFTADGTWTKPVGLVYAIVRINAATGGGGGGGGGNEDVNDFGGNGGIGGNGGRAISFNLILDADLSATEAIVLGSGGAGGAGGTAGSGLATGGTGATGADATVTTFGDTPIIFTQDGGLGGLGGTGGLDGRVNGADGADGAIALPSPNVATLAPSSTNIVLAPEGIGGIGGIGTNGIGTVTAGTAGTAGGAGSITVFEYY